MSHVAALSQPFDTLVFKHEIAGTIYLCAVREDTAGWRLISFLTENAANSTTVIQAGINGLSVGRTWFETCVVMGNYRIGERINLANLTELDLTMAEIVLDNNANPTPITYQGQSMYTMLYITSTDVVVRGGHIDGNGDNQNINRNWMLVWCNGATGVKLIDMWVVNSCFGVNAGANFRAFCYWVGESSQIHLDRCRGNHAGYEIVAIRNNNNYIKVSGGRFYDGAVHIMQVTDIWWYAAATSTNIEIDGNVLINDYSGAVHVFTVHSGANVNFHNNRLNGGTSITNCLIKVIGTSSNIWLEENQLFWNISSGTRAGIRLGEAGDASSISDIHIINNKIKCPATTGTNFGVWVGDAGAVLITDIDIIENHITTTLVAIYNEDVAITKIHIEANWCFMYSTAGSGIAIASSMSYSWIINNKAIFYGSAGTYCMYLTAVTYTVVIGNYCTNGAWGIYETGACDYNRYIGNNLITIATLAQRLRMLGVNDVARDNLGYNPLGFSATTPAVPATGVDAQNTYGYTVRIYILTIGTVTAYQITDPLGGVQSITTILFAGMEITLDPAAKIRFTYTVAPTWKWLGT